MKKIKLFAMAFAALVCGSTWAATPSVTITVTSETTLDAFNGTYNSGQANEITLTTEGISGMGSKKLCGGSTNMPTFQMNSSDSQYLEFALPESSSASIDSVLFRIQGNNTGTTDWFNPVFYCEENVFNATNIFAVGEVRFVGYDQPCGDFMLTIPEGVKSFRMYRRAKYTAPAGETPGKVGAGSNYGSGQTSHTTYLEVYMTYAQAPMVKSYKIAGVEATIDQENKTITAELPYGTDKGAAIAAATVTYGGTATEWKYNEDNTKVIVSDGTTPVEYTLVISVKETASTDATLKAITVDEVALSGFAADKYDYQMLASGLPVVAAEANDVAAKVDIEQAAANPGTATITVTAQDGETKLVYTIAFTSADKICGTLINALTTSASAATVTGNLTGTADVKLKDVAEYEGYTGYKMSSNDYYFGITLTQGAFRQGDVLNFFVTKVDAGKKAELFTDKGTTSIYVAENQTELGVNSIVLPAAAEGATSLYLYRNATNSYNPTIAYMEVVRDCNPKLMDFTIAGITATIDQELLTVTANLPYGTVLTDNDWNNAYTLNGAATGAEYGAEHATLAVKGGEEDLVYTLNITISQEQSSNNNLSKITVNGNEVANFSAAVTEYTYTLPYGTAEMPVIAAETEDITATVVVDQVDSLTQNVKITVTAQNEAQKVYSVQLAVAAAPKELTSVQFSNGAYGAINDGIVQVPYMGTMPTMTDYVAENATAIAQDDKIIVTSTLDQTTREYALQGVELTAGASCNVGITFDGTESYVFAHYGWDADKGYKFAKAVDEASNMRIAKGNTRLYMALPAAYTVTLTSGTGGKRNINVYVNGVKDETVTATAASGATITINLNPTADNFLMIESNQTGGDGGFTAMTVTNTPTALKDAIMSSKAVKFMHRGIMYIRHENKFYNVLGNPVKF